MSRRRPGREASGSTDAEWAHSVVEMIDAIEALHGGEVVVCLNRVRGTMQPILAVQTIVTHHAEVGAARPGQETSVSVTDWFPTTNAKSLLALLYRQLLEADSVAGQTFWTQATFAGDSDSSDTMKPTGE